MKTHEPMKVKTGVVLALLAALTFLALRGGTLTAGASRAGGRQGREGMGQVNRQSAGQPALTSREDSTFTTIDFPGAHDTVALDINHAGEIVGRYRSATDGNTYGFLLRRNGEFTTIDFPGAVLTVAAAINSRGNITGQYRLAGEAASVRHGFLRSKDGSFTTIDFPGAIFTNALGINPRGDIVGRYCAVLPCTPRSGNFHGFLRSKNGDFTSIDFPGAVQTVAWKINRRGKIVGSYLGTDGKFHVYLLSGGDFTTIDIPGAVEAIFENGGINPRGDIVSGYCDAEPCTLFENQHGFLRSKKGEFTTIDFPGGIGIFCSGINARGDIVGTYRASGRDHGFLLSREDRDEDEGEDNE